MSPGWIEWWFLLQALFVDHRAYPLFSILFGFGMAILGQAHDRRRERRVAREGSARRTQRGWIPPAVAVFDEDVGVALVARRR